MQRPRASAQPNHGPRRRSNPGQATKVPLRRGPSPYRPIYAASLRDLHPPRPAGPVAICRTRTRARPRASPPRGRSGADPIATATDDTSAGDLVERALRATPRERDQDDLVLVDGRRRWPRFGMHPNAQRRERLQVTAPPRARAVQGIRTNFAILRNANCADPERRGERPGPPGGDGRAALLRQYLVSGSSSPFCRIRRNDPVPRGRDRVVRLRRYVVSGSPSTLSPTPDWSSSARRR